MNFLAYGSNRTRLDYINLTFFDGPLDVLGKIIMLLEFPAELGQLKDFRVSNLLFSGLVFSQGQYTVLTAPPDHLFFLHFNCFGRYLARFFVDLVVVGGDGPLDDHFTQAMDGFDDYLVFVIGNRIDSKHAS